MSSAAVARRYAAALVALADEKSSLDAVAADLESFGALLAASPELRHALVNPSFTRVERNKVVSTLLARGRSNVISRNFLALFIDNNRMAAFAEMLEAFRSEYDSRRGRVRAQVSSAVELDADTLKTLEKQIQLLTGKQEVVLQSHVDPSLIGGIVTQVGDLVLDGSIRTQLNSLRNSLLAQEAVGDA